MRAALVNHRYPPFRGGSELYFQKIAEWLHSRGVSTRVLTTNAFDLEYFWDSSRQTIGAPVREIINGVEVERLPVEHTPFSTVLFPIVRRGMGEASRIVGAPSPFRHLSRTFPNVSGLREALSREPRPDLIISGNLGLEGLAITALESARETGAAFVLAPFAHLGEGPQSVARRYVSMPHHRELVRRSDMLIALTGMEARFLEEIGAQPSKIVVAGAGVDLPGCSGVRTPDGVARAEEPFTVLSIGALAMDKGTDQLVEASRILADRGFGHRLVLVGPELQSFSNWFEATDGEQNSWIERPGIVSEEEKQKLLADADVFALPSRTESFGIVYLEAWVHRRPVIGAAVGAVTDVIADEVDGLLVPFGEPAALAQAIERLKSDPGLAERLGEAGYAKVARKYTWEQVLRRIEIGFLNVLGIELG
ncbi:glycosyltransferase family 4 protein [soil metagenome]